jgi:DNA-binding transcriptional LysR family regulator
MNEYLPTVPFDLYELHLVQLVAAHGSFTAAANAAGLTQSAVTRQIQGVEQRLGVTLFERTTRHVSLTPAGHFLMRECGRLTGDLDAILLRFRQEFANAPKEVRVGVSKTISMAYLPGFFAAQQRRRPGVVLRVSHLQSDQLLEQVEANAIDTAILCLPRRLPTFARVCHQFDDAFDLIAPSHWDAPTAAMQKAEKRWSEWLQSKPWLLPPANTNTGSRLRAWLKKRGWPASGAVEADSFDLIINLVALGQGVSLVPKRALAIYGRKRTIRRIHVKQTFSRKIAIVARKHPSLAPHVADFIENILF